MKYLISNCPAITQMTKLCDNACPKVQMCKDISDCLLKKIVSECASAKHRASDYSTNAYNDGIYYQADRVLGFLRIEECENDCI